MSAELKLDLDEAIDAFATVAKNKPNSNDSIAESTVYSYRRNIRFFIEYLREEQNKGILDAETSDLRKYLTECSENGDKDKTIVTRRSAISRFYAELPTLAEDDYIPIPPSECPKNPEDGYDGTWRVKSSHKADESAEDVQYLSPAEIKKLWTNVPAPTLRNRLMIRLCYQTGCRAGELTKLKVSHIDRDDRTIRIPTSISKSDARKVVYKPSLDSLLQRWLDGGYRDAVPRDSPFLFPTSRGDHISKGRLRDIVHEAANEADLNEEIYTDTIGKTRTKVSPHILRHSFAVNTLKHNVLNVRELQEILGHTSLETTEIYLEAASDDAKDRYRQNGGVPEA